MTRLEREENGNNNENNLWEEKNDKKNENINENYIWQEKRKRIKRE